MSNEEQQNKNQTAGWIVVFIFVILALAGYGTSQNDDDDCYSVPTAQGLEYYCE
jgi:hypothetical protein